MLKLDRFLNWTAHVLYTYRVSRKCIYNGRPQITWIKIDR